jgi:hypothetical protein
MSYEVQNCLHTKFNFSSYKVQRVIRTQHSTAAVQAFPALLIGPDYTLASPHLTSSDCATEKQKGAKVISSLTAKQNNTFTQNRYLGRIARY